MKLLPGESTLSEASVAGLTLTTHRVRYDQRTSGASQIIGITLDAVSSCGLVSKSHPILLLLAVLAGGFGAFSRNAEEGGEQSIMYGLLFTAAALVVAYFITRTVVLVISSSGQSITISATGMKPDALVAVVDDVEQAKLKYLEDIELRTRLESKV